jgi:hypothetical protein
VVQPSRESVYRVSKKTLATAASVVATLATIFFSVSVRSRGSHSADGRRITAERGCCRYCLRARTAEITDSLVYKPWGEGLLTNPGYDSTRPGYTSPVSIRVRSLFLLLLTPIVRDFVASTTQSRTRALADAGTCRPGLWTMPEDRFRRVDGAPRARASITPPQ